MGMADALAIVIEVGGDDLGFGCAQLDVAIEHEVDGGLIGGAALKAPDFLSMLKTASR